MKARLHPRPTLAFALATALPLACVPSPEPYVPVVADGTDTKGIVGGENTTIQEHPWQVSLRSAFGGAFCGGSVIDAEWVLTAAHCVEGSSPGGLRVVAGITRQSQASSGQVRTVDQIISFPGYVRPENGRDVALLRLTAPLDLTDPGVAVVPLVTQADVAAGLTEPGVTAQVSGWGALFSGGRSPDVLQVVDVPLVSNSAAQNAYRRTITDDQLAAGVLGVGGRDSCQGDSGGPLTVSDGAGGRKLAGVVSWGFGCASARYPGMYARVSAYVGWIEGFVRPNQAPRVAITAPQSGATVRGTVAITADATDVDGRISRVTFTFPDGRTVNDTRAPYAAQWDSTGFADGPGTVRVQAFDDRGAASDVAEIRIVAANGNQSCATGTLVAAGLPLAIPDANPTGITASLDVTGGGTLQQAQVSLQISHTYRGDLVVLLVSPSGTRLTLSNRSGGNADDLVLNGVGLGALEGEPASGRWQLVVRDLAGQDVGRLERWSLDLVTDCGGAPPPSGPFTAESTPNLPTRNEDTVCDSVTVTGAGDAASVRLELDGQHTWRAALAATLSHNGVTVRLFDAGTFERGAGDFRVQGARIPGFSGPGTGEWTLCLTDTDGFGDSGRLRRWRVFE